MIDLGQDALTVAPQLLGSLLCHGEVVLRITEVEAYLGTSDPASHAFRGPTGRSSVMFGPPGHVYVYLSYGIHLAMNIVCSPDGDAGAVLVRSGEVVGGEPVARARREVARRSSTPLPAPQLARGPGCVGQAMGLLIGDSGARLHQAAAMPAGLDPRDFWLLDAPAPARVAAGPRVGVSAGAEVAWRFWVEGDATVSAYQRSRRAPLPGSP